MGRPVHAIEQLADKTGPAMAHNKINTIPLAQSNYAAVINPVFLRAEDIIR